MESLLREYTDGHSSSNVAINCTTVGLFLIAWFNDWVLGKSGQIANPVIANVDPHLLHVCDHESWLRW